MLIFVLEGKMKALDKTARCTYFPMEDKYLVFTNANIWDNPYLVGPPLQLTGNFHTYKADALREAIEVLSKK